MGLYFLSSDKRLTLHKIMAMDGKTRRVAQTPTTTMYNKKYFESLLT